MSREVVLGPPGTGKTTYLMGVVQSLISEDWRQPTSIAFVSYSRSAVETARQRISAATGRPEHEFRHFRTLHSTFGAILGLRMSDYVGKNDLQLFYEMMGYTAPVDGDSDLLDILDEPSKGGLLMRLLEYQRQTMGTVDAAVARGAGVVIPDEFVLFTERYNAFRKKMRLRDFTDILEMAVAQGLRIPAPVVIVDEAQDLSPLQVAALVPSVRDSERVWVAGDDDQAIYSYQGASPHWLMELWNDPAWSHKLLDVSHRCPEPVRALGEQVIGRCVERIDKPYRSKHANGSVRRATWTYAVSRMAELPAPEQAFVLARTGSFVANACNALFDMGIPYLAANSKGGANPMGQTKIMFAAEVFNDLRAGRNVAVGDFLRALDAVPSRGGDYVRYGTRAQIEKAPIAHIHRDMASDYGFGGLIRAIDVDMWRPLRDKYTARRDQRNEVSWLQRAWERGGGAWPVAQIRVMTWHASKGQEAEIVVVDPSLNKLCLETLDGPEADSEHRCAYVALTRAKRELIIVDAAEKSAGAYAFA